MHNTLDVIVIGAGLSGLYSAYQLQQQGLQTVILEARPRLGGRIHGMEIHHLHSLDLGPSWFWPHQVEMQQLCERLNLTIFEQYITGQALYQASSDHPVERFLGAGAMTSYRLKGGLGQLTAALAQRLSAHSAYLNESVQHCRFDKGLWQIRSRSLTLHAKQLIVATPPRVALTTTDISKVLSEPLRQTLLNTPTWMASQAKFVAHYPQPFWRLQGLSGDAFSRVGPLVEIHDASAATDHGFALFGFVGIPTAQRINMPADALSDACLKQLGALFGSAALAPIATALEDWSQQPLTCTAADIQQVPQHPQCNLGPFATELQQLQLNFSSTEVATREAGYLEGALVAASTTVQNILNHMPLRP